MKKIGFVLSALGLVTLLGSCVTNTAPEGTHNIGLLQEQMMTFSLGGLLVLIGAIVSSVGYVLERMEAAGVLPPAGMVARRPGQPRQP